MTGRRGLVGVLVVAIALGVVARCTTLWPDVEQRSGATRLRLETAARPPSSTTPCRMALLRPGRIADVGDRLEWFPLDSLEPGRVRWPSGWSAWRTMDIAVLLDRDARVVAREGDVIEGYGGGVDADGVFAVCG